MACTIIAPMCNSEERAMQSSRHHWQTRSNGSGQHSNFPIPSVTGRGRVAKAKETKAKQKTTTKPKPQTTPHTNGNLATLHCTPQAKARGAVRDSSANYLWRQGRHAHRGTRRGPNPTTAKNTPPNSAPDKPAQPQSSAQACLPLRNSRE